MFVYIIGAKNNWSPIKIGMSVNPVKRMKNVQSGNPYKLHIIHLIKSESAETLEKHLHNEVWGHKMHGEWFKRKALTRIEYLLKTYGTMNNEYWEIAKDWIQKEDKP